MADPSLLNDGVRFFPNVLNDRKFMAHGVLARTEGRVSWAVVDPRRHIMTIWEKDVDRFPEAAKRRTGASVLTNGPFLLYSGGNKYLATIKYGLNLLWRNSLFGGGIKGSASATLEQMHKNEAELKKKYFTGHQVEGYLYGDSEHIARTKNSRPKAYYFGRKSGRLFGDYVIAKGDPPHHPEVIGGLFLSVDNYTVKDNGTASQVGTWGLAPLAAAGGQPKVELEQAGLTAAIESYEAAMLAPSAEGWVPYGPHVPANTPCPGLLLAVFGAGSPHAFATHNVNVRVEKAVRVDGNSSILLAHYGTLLQGQYMIEAKVYYNRWGYMFKPG